MKDTEFERKQTFGDYLNKIKALLNKDSLPDIFCSRMLGPFVQGLTPKQAIDDFCRNQNTELEREIKGILDSIKN